MRPHLPIDEHLGLIAALVESHRRLVVTAPPGSGKSTRVPPALVAPGPVFLLQPRRVAARSLARRIASEQGWTLGRQVGYQVRFENVASAATRIKFVTEGILLRRMIDDPTLAGTAALIFDEASPNVLAGVAAATAWQFAMAVAMLVERPTA